MEMVLIAVGHKMPDWVNKGFAEYAGRFSGDMKMTLQEIPLQKRTDAGQIAATRSKEAQALKNALSGCDYAVILDIPGRVHSSESLALRLQFWQAHYRRVGLVIGGPEGIADEVKALAQESWSLGPLTLPHPLVRIVVAEALYRARSINAGHPYHRA